MATFTSKASGNWDAAGQTTWNEVGTPTTNQDSVTINTGHTVTGNANFTLAAGATLTVAATGVLNVDATHTITFDAASTVANAGTIDFAAYPPGVTLGGSWSGAGGVSVATSVAFAAGMSWVGYTGSLTFDSTSLARTVTYNGVSGPKLIVNNAGTTSLTAALGTGSACTAMSFTLTAGIYADAELAHNIGDAAVTTGIIITAGTFTSTGTWTLTNSGYLNNNSSAWKFGEFSMPTGVTATLSAPCYMAKLSGAGTIVIPTALAVRLYAAAGNFWTFTGSVSASGSGAVQLFGQATPLTNAAAVAVGTTPLVITTALGSDVTLTFSERITCGTLNALAGAVDKFVHAILNGGVTAGGKVTVGAAAANTKLGKLSLAGICSFADGFALATGSTGTLHELNLGSCYLTLTGTLDGTGVLFSNIACAIQGGTVSNLTDDPTVKIHAYGATDGGGNTAAYIDFDQHAPPGSLAGAGVGI